MASFDEQTPEEQVRTLEYSLLELQDRYKQQENYY